MMPTLKNKNILVAITGSIAAYKAAILVRLLITEGAKVRVIMSQDAKNFITPLTMATVSQNPIVVENFDPENGAWNSHIKLGEWADYFLIAPATANTIAKMRGGIADNLLLCTYLSARCPVAIAPAMDYEMYLHPTTRGNIQSLHDIGVKVIESGDGFLASGLIGRGRMAEPHVIVNTIKDEFTPKLLKGKRVMITAGATVESIDPVRYISNHSSGKMGYALADRVARLGADVTLISGHATAKLHNQSTKLINVQSAAQMYEASQEQFPQMDIAIFCAAVADYTPKIVEHNKIKTARKESLNLELVKTQDIAAVLGAEKRANQLTVCFALETDNEHENAIKKMADKNADIMVLNSLQEQGAGFGTDTNKVVIFLKDGSFKEFPLKSKEEVAEDISQIIIENLP